MTVDTLQMVQKLEKKEFTREQFEEIVYIMRDSQSELFTKKDAEIMENGIRKDMINMELRMIIKLGSIVVLAIGAMAGIMKLIS